MLRLILVATTLTGFLASCVLPRTTAAPMSFATNYLPTVVHLTAESIYSTHAVNVKPIGTAKAEPTLISSTAVLTDTPTPASGNTLGAIQISAPGLMSRVVSPLEVHLIAIAGASKKISVDLYSEDGTLLGESIQAVAGSQSGDPFFVKIRFEIQGASETGTLQISTKDASGRVESLNTVRVFLLSSGVNQINPPGNTIYERVTFHNLAPNDSVYGGVLSLAGQMLPFNQQPVILELIGDDGKILGLRELTFNGLDSQSFQTTIPFKVSGATPARLFVNEEDDKLNMPGYIYSQPITLNP